jgi:hypothetical protein
LIFWQKKVFLCAEKRPSFLVPNGLESASNLNHLSLTKKAAGILKIQNCKRWWQSHRGGNKNFLGQFE